MSSSYLSIARLSRRLTTGTTEALTFQPGVNLLIGQPNTGKTKWLQMLDHLLGDPSPFESTFDEQLYEKYDAISAELVIGEQTLNVERRWKEPGSKSKVFVDGEPLSPRDCRHVWLDQLGIPL
jgi:predicted ATP-dependent endonuclease of OLD family